MAKGNDWTKRTEYRLHGKIGVEPNGGDDHDDDDELYGASPVKRYRATQDEMQERRDRLYEIIEEQQPATVRQAFYQATVRDLPGILKLESGYKKVQILLAQMRREGILPFGWIADLTRYQRKPRSYDSVAEALEETARLYRKKLWSSAACYVEVWIEKDALSGVIYPVTSLYDVPLMVARGYSSITFLHSSAEYINTLDVPAYIYHLGDYDPSGVNAAEKIEQTLREFAPDAEIHFKRLAVTPDQIRRWRLPTRPTKQSDTRAKKFGSDISVELDAIDANMLRDIVRKAIEQHLPADQLAVQQEAEMSEKQMLKMFVRRAKRDSER